MRSRSADATAATVETVHSSRSVVGKVRAAAKAAGSVASDSVAPGKPTSSGRMLHAPASKVANLLTPMSLMMPWFHGVLSAGLARKPLADDAPGLCEVPDPLIAWADPTRTAESTDLRSLGQPVNASQHKHPHHRTAGGVKGSVHQVLTSRNGDAYHRHQGQHRHHC